MPHGKSKRLFKKNNASSRNECLYQFHQANNVTAYSLQWSVEPLLSDTSNQGTPPFRGHKILVRKNAHIIYGSNASIKKGHLYSLERDPFSVSYNFNPRLATRAAMSLSQAQNMMPATTINT